MCSLEGLYLGDNLAIMRGLAAESVDLGYADPPFFSQRNYYQLDAGGRESAKPAKPAFSDNWFWDDASELSLRRITTPDFTPQCLDLMEGLVKVLGRGGLAAYLLNQLERINELHRLLKPSGSFYLHCDPTASHYLKLILDSVFIPRGGVFVNEIIWHYRKWAVAKRKFSANHDVIFFYAKSPNYCFNLQYQDRAPSTLKTFGTKKIISAVDEKGRRIPSRTSDAESAGVKMADVWPISIIAPVAKQRLGYPTQKPEALLERIILASSNPADLVLDIYCGSGTTVAVAARLGRRWLGIDNNPDAIAMSKERVGKL
ncbi:MAG: site-specific DNA-methyltransferase [Candidatus Pacebacteria bacterium]|nr:site-specific DNA-methyltransferase [Candidatus Paceibacterota bacterium]